MNASLNPLFYGFACLAAVLALASVLTRKILRSAVFLMGVLSLTAGFYLLLGAEFLAGVQVLVYVGGIVVLLVFAVMLTASNELEETPPAPERRVLALVASGSFFAVTAWSLTQVPRFRVPAPPLPSGGDIRALGHAFLDPGPGGYLLPFEVISLLLLAVLIGGIVLAATRKERE